MNDSNKAFDDAHDRLTDRVLTEAIGGETPPDQSAAIADRYAESQSVPSSGQGSGLQTRRAWITLLATAASLMVAVVVFQEHRGRFGERITARGEVLRGKESESLDRESQLGLVDELSSLPRLQEELSFGDRLPTEGKAVSSVKQDSDGDGDLDRTNGSAVYIDAESRPETEGLRRQSLALVSESLAGHPKGQAGAEAVADGSLNKMLAESSRRLEHRGVSGAIGRYERVAGSQPFDAPATRAPLSSTSNPGFAGGGVGGRPGLATTRRNGMKAAPKRLEQYSADSPSQLGDTFGVDSILVYDGVDTNGDGTPRNEASQPSPYYVTDDVRYYAPSVGLHLKQLDRSRIRPERKSGDRFAAIQENEFIRPEGAKALSTFSIDVDTASYTGVRQYLLDARQLPPPDAVRIEELINYFDYAYTAPAAGSEDPFTAAMAVQPCPWKPEHKLVRIGIKGREVDAEKRPLSNLVFLVDVSGSMNEPNKLPLVVEGLKALTEKFGENDRVAIVVYAGSEGLVLPSTSGTKRDEIRSALGRLQAGGSTAGGAGLKLAYEIAERHKIPGGVNRVVLCTDGDFNVGLTGTEELAKLVESRGKEQGIFLTVLGFGRGNLNDEMLEAISGRGDGHYAYIDSEREARRVLSRDLAGTLVTIAKDVKLQVEFNPAKVASYRLIGYENRVMAAKDFNDDTKDAGEIGAGHTVTALYEVVPVGVEEPAPPVDGLKYQQEGSGAGGQDSAKEPTADSQQPIADSNELLTLKIRYKQPEGGASKKLEFPLADSDGEVYRRVISEWQDFRWAAAVAEFGMLLRNSRHAGDASFDSVLENAREAIGEDPNGYRAEFLDLVRRARELRAGE